MNQSQRKSWIWTDPLVLHKLQQNKTGKQIQGRLSRNLTDSYKPYARI